MQYRFRHPRVAASAVRAASGAVAASAGVWAAAALLSLSASSAAFAAADALASKADHFLTASKAAERQSGWSRVIVQTTGGDVDSSRKTSLRSLGGYVYRHLDSIDAAAVRIPNRSLSGLASLGWVKRLSTDAPVKKHDEFTVEHSGANVAYADYGLTGAGITVAVIDSGVREHKDLGLRVVGSVDFVRDGLTGDPLGHGTHVAGIIAGNGYSSTGEDFYRTFYGVARGANIANVRVLDSTGNGAVSNVIAGIEWSVKRKKALNLRVINLSLGHPVFESYKTDPLCQAVESAWKNGIVVVCSAGNTGRLQDLPDPAQDNEGFGTAYGSIQSPGNSPYVITVGAMKSHPDGKAGDRIATYSSRGPSRLDMVVKPDLVAPGNRVISLTSHSSLLEGEFKDTNEVKLAEYAYTNGNNDSNKYFRLSGTSMAAPVVSGAVALMLEKDSRLSADTIKARLMISADKWTYPDGSADLLTFGAGYLNIPAALNSTAKVSQKINALSPYITAYSDGNLYVYMDRAIWGGAGSLWGTGVTDLRAIWGKAAISESNIVADSFVASIVTDTRAIWGKAYQVEADRAIWGRALSAVADMSWHVIEGEE